MTFSIDTIITASVADEQSDLANQAGESVFADLREVIHTYSCNTREFFEQVLEGTEVEFMETYLPNSWKFSKLPVKYRSAKSVLSTALDAGVNIPAEIGKSALEKVTKENKPLTAQQAQKALIAACKKVSDLTMEEWDTLDSKVISAVSDILTYTGEIK
jgi:hypothetical protein